MWYLRSGVRPEWTIEDAIAALDADDGSAAVVAAVLPAGDPIIRLVDVLVGATTSLFPAWLPDAEGIDDASVASVAAVRRLAGRAAGTSDLFGPVVEALAAQSVGGHADLSGVPVETLVRECFKLVCRSYGTERAHLVLDTEGDPADLPHLAGWLAALETFDLTLVHRAAAAFPRNAEEAPASIQAAAPAVRGLVHLSAVEGRPSPTSETEKRIEARLRECLWAAGRAWNRRFVPGPLVAPIHPDLMFAEALLVVEFDGPDHMNRAKYAADRRRDRILQRCGFAVFRFTNDEVALDIERVIDEIAAEVARRSAP